MSQNIFLANIELFCFYYIAAVEIQAGNMQQRQWCDGKQRSVVAVELGTLLHAVTDAMDSTDKRCGKLPSLSPL